MSTFWVGMISGQQHLQEMAVYSLLCVWVAVAEVNVLDVFADLVVVEGAADLAVVDFADLSFVECPFGCLV